MSSHEKITPLFSDGVFFAHPGKPRQRGSNENVNGLLEWTPKHSDLSVHSAETLSTIAAKLNDRPWKRLNWVTPAQLFVCGLESHEQAGVATTA